VSDESDNNKDKTKQNKLEEEALLSVKFDEQQTKTNLREE
jgi:hypothetical protein